VKILVTGATGFIGRHVVPELIARGHQVVATARNPAHADHVPWYGRVRFVACDLHKVGLDPVTALGVPEAIVHLAWSGLANYKDLSHFESTLPASYRFIKNMVTAGTKQVLVTGTCFEYGMQNGPLSEEAPALPSNPYGLAKDTLRKFLQALQSKQSFTLQWIRLFYMYGPGQSPDSLLAQLDRAIDSGDTVFNMSGGEQLRDYLPVEVVARQLATLVQRGAEMTLNLGCYPYPDYEPFAFWGDAGKIRKLLNT
jgi:nucleoside-diphosphate-sugar epimerase